MRPTFELAVRDDIIRRNPVDGAYAEVKKRNGGARKSRRALTVEQQREFIDYVAKNPFFFHWYPFFVFLLGTGCRIGEALGIEELRELIRSFPEQGITVIPVSYTHLDVYKRQELDAESVRQ